MKFDFFYILLFLIYQTFVQSVCKINNCINCYKAPLGCIECSESYYRDADTLQCKRCPNYCNLCSSGKSCLECKIGNYFNDYVNYCDDCLPNCDTCLDRLGCSRCSLGFYKETGPKQCIKCSDNCAACLGNTSCFQCDKGYYLESKVCTKCFNNCDECTSGKSCASCQDNFYWNDITEFCETCGEGCEIGECKKNLGCAKCSNNYYLDGKICKPCLISEENKCLNCVPTMTGYLWNLPTQHCINCPEYCLNCDIFNICMVGATDMCITGKVWDPTSLTCTDCSTFIQKMPLNVVQNSCHKCNGLYYDLVQNSCVACTINTPKTSTLPCLHCIDYNNNYYSKGYFHSAGNCKSYDCSAVQTNSMSWCDYCNGYYWDFGMADCKPKLCDGSVDITTVLVQSECEACTNRVWITGKCTAFVCDPGWTTQKIDKCGKYWNGLTNTCDPVQCYYTATLTELECKGCHNRYWDTSALQCFEIDCFAINLLITPDKCYGCRRLGWYWDSVTSCTFISKGDCDAEPTDIDKCTGCEEMDWDAGQNKCKKITGDTCTSNLITEKQCNFCFGLKIAGVNLKAVKCITKPDISHCHGLSYLNSGGTAKKLHGTVLDDQYKCSGVLEKSWVGGNCVDSPVGDCISPSFSQVICNNCFYGIWDPILQYCTNLDCNTASAIPDLILLQPSCIRCESLKTGLSWISGSTCVVNDCSFVNIPTYIEQFCRSCMQAYWSSGSCKNVNCAIQPLTDIDYCESCGLSWDSFGSKCWVCPQNSVSCDNNGATCTIGYYWELSTWSCVQISCSTDNLNSLGKCSACINRIWNSLTNICDNCPVNCDTCLNSLICVTCAETYIWNIATMQCEVCSYATINYCSNCPLTLLVNIPQCVVCTLTMLLNDEDTCLRCGLAVTGGTPYWNELTSTCLNCPLNCLECIDNSICTKCIIGYYFNNENVACEACLSGCLVCASVDICSDCGVGYFFNSESLNCEDCVTNCNECTDKFSCQECAINTYFDVNICKECINNCIECSTNRSCSKCAITYYVRHDRTTIVCESCPQNCDFCLSFDKCTLCSEGYCVVESTGLCIATNEKCKMCREVFVGKLIQIDCLDCIDRYQLEVCKPCSVGCKICLANDICDICQYGYFKSELVCLACPKDCKVCENSTSCVKCNQPTIYYSQSLNQCYACRHGCKDCLDGVTCSSCIIGFLLFEETSVCEPCPKNCLSCSTADTCNACIFKNMYFDQTVKSCQYCRHGCKTCVNSLNCLKCTELFIFDPISNLCIACGENCLDFEKPCEIGYYLKTKENTRQCIKCSNVIDHCTSCQVKNATVICDECDSTTPRTLNYKQSECLDCSLNCLKCLDPKPVCKECQVNYFPTLNNYSCANKECYTCDGYTDDCSDNINTFQKTGCHGDCYKTTLSFYTNVSVATFRSCKEELCTPINHNGRLCINMTEREMCVTCCDTHGCNIGDMSSTFKQNFRLFLISVIFFILFSHM